MNRWISLLALVAGLFVMPVLAEGIYTWEDENGQKHYSDMPRDGAEEIELQPAQTFSNPTASAGGASAADAEGEEEAGTDYQSIAITSPGKEETIWNSAGNISVSWKVQPSLVSGHKMRLFLDGKPQAQIQPTATSATLTGVERGSHKVQVAVLDEDGRTVIQSNSVIFFVQQAATGPRAATPRAAPNRVR